MVDMPIKPYYQVLQCPIACPPQFQDILMQVRHIFDRWSLTDFPGLDLSCFRDIDESRLSVRTD